MESHSNFPVTVTSLAACFLFFLGGSSCGVHGFDLNQMGCLLQVNSPGQSNSSNVAQHILDIYHLLTCT